MVFKLLNQSRSGQISLDEFYEVYDATLFRWNVPRLEKDWFGDLWRPVRDVLKTVQKAVTSKWFEYTVCKLKQHFLPSITMCLGMITFCHFRFGGPRKRPHLTCADFHHGFAIAAIQPVRALGVLFLRWP